MWTCSKCGRLFEKTGQPHSCRHIPLVQHFRHKEKAEELFVLLRHQICERIGKSRIISLPCCIHLFGSYDYLAVLPKKDRLEIRFSLRNTLKSPRLKQAVPLSSVMVKNCVDLTEKTDIDNEVIGWLRESYHLKDKPAYPSVPR